MARFRHIEPAPADAETYRSLKIHRYESGPSGTGVGALRAWRSVRYFVKAWRGRAQKPYAHYQFPSAEKREQWITQQKQDAAARESAKVRRKAEADQDLAAMVDRLTVGALLCYSWGYDQTQCEFFEVVARPSRRKVTLRRIAGEVVEGKSSNMSEMLRPVPGGYVDEPFDKMISRYGIRMRNGHARPTTADAEHYCSWYA